MRDGRSYNKHPENRRKQQNKRTILLILGITVAALLLGGFYLWRLRQDDYHTGKRAPKQQDADEAAVFDGEASSNGSEESAYDTGESAYDTEEDADVVYYNEKAYRYHPHLSNYLLMGIDTKGDIQAEREGVRGGQADTIYLVSYDRKDEDLHVFSIPRETITLITLTDMDGNVLGSAEEFLTLQYGYGDGRFKSCEMMCEAVSHLFYGIPITGYAAVNLDSLPVLAGLLGGVEVTLPDDSMADVNPDWKAGETVLLDEENAEIFLRHRDTDKDLSALVRMERQKTFVRAFADKLKAMQSKDAGTVTRVYEGLKPYMITNMGNDIFVDFALAKQEGEIKTIPGEGVATDAFDEYHVDEDALYKMLIQDFYLEQS